MVGGAFGQKQKWDDDDDGGGDDEFVWCEGASKILYPRGSLFSSPTKDLREIIGHVIEPKIRHGLSGDAVIAKPNPTSRRQPTKERPLHDEN